MSDEMIGKGEQGAAQARPLGGTARPEHRQCGHVHVSGEPCGGWAMTGEKFCAKHHAWAGTDPMYPVKVPLLEDPDSIRLVISQTVRALAVGTLPSANGRAMLAGCRMAMALLVHELAAEKWRARGASGQCAVGSGQVAVGSGQCAVGSGQVAENQVTGDGLRVAESPVTGDGLQVTENQVTGDGLRVTGAEAEAAVESHVCQHPADMGHPTGLEQPHPSKTGSDGAPSGAEEFEQPHPSISGSRPPQRANGTLAGGPGSGAPTQHPITPRFPDLAEVWEKSVAREANEVGRNLQRREDETVAQWQTRQVRKIEAGHPLARRLAQRCDPLLTGAPRDLPFDPACPPSWDHERMKDWPPEHMEAWLRSLSPDITDRDVREFLRAMWAVPKAEKLARWPSDGSDPGEDCLFWQLDMDRDRIAMWYQAQIPEMPEQDAQELARDRAEKLKQAREKWERGLAASEKLLAKDC
jgi:hypothetical protein